MNEKLINIFVVIVLLLFVSDVKADDYIRSSSLEEIITQDENTMRRDYVNEQGIITYAADLRYATDKEYKSENVITCFIEKLQEIVFDIQNYGNNIKCATKKVSDDARNNSYIDAFDCVITSPPY